MATKKNGDGNKELRALMKVYLEAEGMIRMAEADIKAYRAKMAEVVKNIAQVNGMGPIVLADGRRLIPIMRKLTDAGPDGTRVERGTSYYFREDSPREDATHLDL